jgi:hypothetical protein
MDDLKLPWFTSTWWVLLVFAFALLGWHLLLIRRWPLTRAGWKKTDYYWVSLALIGVLGHVGANRREVAHDLAATAQSRVEIAQTQIEQAIALGQSPAICHAHEEDEHDDGAAGASTRAAAVRDDNERGLDEMCAWFHSAEACLESTPFAKREPIKIEDLGAPLPKGGDPWAIDNPQEAIGWYNAAVARAKKISVATELSALEEIASVVGPVLLAVAVALRITKVTGELRLEEAQRSTLATTVA